MISFEAIFFDLDGTLVNGGIAWRTTVKETIRQVCEADSGINPDALEAAYYDAASAAWETIKVPSPPTWGSMEAEAVVVAVWTNALQGSGAVGEDIVARAVTVYYSKLLEYGATAYDDVADCLRRLRQGYRLGIITNGNLKVQQAKIDRAGLSQYFDTVTTPDVGAGKPDRLIFECATQAMGVRSQASVYVGDLLEWDIGGANNAGMVSVWLNRKKATCRHCDPIPDATIESLSELPEVIGRMESNELSKP